MGQYTQYIQEHINNFNGQLPFHWKTPGYRGRLEIVCSRYRKIHGTNDLSESIDRLSDRIGREDIRNLFLKGQFYDGYVATMLWGGIDLTRRNDIQETNGYKALTIKKDVIVEKLKRVSDLLLNNDLPNAFLSFLDNSENRIEGIALSYFTKLLFFLPNNISPKPLIYDKWGIRIHAALMKDENKNYDNSLNIYDPQPFVRGGNNRRVLFQSYLEYCSRINNLYGSLHIDSSKDIEAFLFGMPLRGVTGKDPERNPRKMLIDYLGLDNCNKHTDALEKENIEKKTESKGHSTTHQTSQKSLVQTHTIVQNTHETRQAADLGVTLLKQYKGEKLKAKRDRAIQITEGYQILIKQHVAWVYYGIDPSHKKNYHICKIVFRDKDGKEDKLANKHQIIPNIILDLFPLPRKKEQPSYYQYCEFNNEKEARDKFVEVLSALSK